MCCYIFCKLFVRKLCNFMQLCATCDSAFKDKELRKGFLLRGPLVDVAPARLEATPFHPFDPSVTSCLQPEGRSATRARPFYRQPRRNPPGACQGHRGLLRNPDPAVGMHSAAGRLHSASTVPPSPCQPPGATGKTKEKLFPCCLATEGKPSSRSKGNEEGERTRRKGKKNQDLERIFFVVMYLIKLKDYFALSL